MNASFHDHLNLIRKLTLKKAFNALVLLTSYYKSQWTRRVFHRGMPVSISIEPTTSCNLRCPQCPSGLRSFSRPTGMLDTELYQRTIDELHHTLLYLTLYFQGEPYLNTLFLDMVAYASSRNIYTSTSTNGHYLDDIQAKKTINSGLDRLIISIDGATQESYEKYRVGGKLSKAIEGAKNVVSWKKRLKSKTPYVIIQFLVMKQNQHQLHDIKKLFEEIGADKLVFKTAQVYDFENGSDLLPDLPELSRYKRTEDGNYYIKNQLLNSCWRMWHSCVITWDGKIVPCCFDKDASHALGDMMQQDFKTSWRHKDYNTFRQTLLKSRKEIDICKNCSEGTKVFS